MTRGIVLLGVFDRIRLYFFCDDPLSSRGLSCHDIVLYSCYLFLAFVLVCFAFPRPRKELGFDTRTTLRALLDIVVPTCSLWPGRYVKLAGIHTLHAEIPLDMIIEDTTDGVIELRDPINDLADLVASGAIVNGHTIRIGVPWKWWIRYFEWWLLAESKSGSSNWLNNIIPTMISNHQGLSFSSPTSSLPYSVLCLDNLPCGTIPRLNAGCKVILEFTAFSLSLRIFSKAQIISAVPFILSSRLPRRPRRLLSVLRQLSATYGSSLVIDTLSNISTDYEHTLRHVYQSLSREQGIRAMWTKSIGINTWRREMFLVALEGALLRRGWIERWAIQLIIVEGTRLS